MQKIYINLGNHESETENEGEQKMTIESPGIVPERIEVVLMVSVCLFAMYYILTGSLDDDGFGN